MGLNVSVSSDYENREILRSTANMILARGGASAEETKKIIDVALFNSNKSLKEIYTTPEVLVLRGATQITLSESLRETVKYLQMHANKKSVAKPIFGELWNIFAANNEASEQNPYRGELFDFEPSKNARNIFAA